MLERASGALKVAEGDLLDIALAQLSLGRARFGLVLTALPADETARGAEPANITTAAPYLDRAVAGLRQAGQEQELPRGLLARTALRRVRSDRRGASADLDEAAEIAERGGMRLHLCDVHLERARFHLAAGEDGEARRHLERARALVAETGYHRRDGEVEFLAERLGGPSTGG